MFDWRFRYHGADPVPRFKELYAYLTKSKAGMMAWVGLLKASDFGAASANPGCVFTTSKVFRVSKNSEVYRALQSEQAANKNDLTRTGKHYRVTVFWASE